MLALPIDPLLPDILASLRSNPNLVLEAPPGAGKTTRVPPLLLAFGHVLVLEPRRIAARLAARRVAQELGEPVGETAGYQVRFEEVAGPRTRLRFVTEGVLTRRLLSNPELRGVQVVILDEFHERHLDGDLALALLRRLQETTRPDLRLVVMSATLSAAPIAAYLHDCPVLRAEGRLHELEIRYTPYSNQSLEDQTAGALAALSDGGGLPGDTLVFLPGAAEIRRCQKAIEPLARKQQWLAVPLHGDLSPAEQDQAVSPADRRKVILSTNVAESSITIEGVRAVIDSGLARIPMDSPWSGIPVLRIGRVSQASAIQRAGRAGRMGPGKVIRLYTAEDFHRRSAFDAPEIERRELSSLVLELRVMGLRVDQLDWLSPPPGEAVRAAEELLRRLGALQADGTVTEIGRAMARFPLHPRLARLLTEAERRGQPRMGARIAALLSVGERLPMDTHRVDISDLLVLADSGSDPRAKQVQQQIQRLLLARGPEKQDDTALSQAILTAYPDRVARRRGEELLLAAGGTALLAQNSVVRQPELLVAVDVEERTEQKLPIVRLASAIEAEWLLDLFPERVREEQRVEWNRREERVESVSSLLYDQLVIEESRSGAVDAEQAAALLAERAIEAGLSRFVDPEEWEAFQARAEFASRHGPVTPMQPEQVATALRQLAYGLRSFRELEAAARAGGFLAAVQSTLPANELRSLQELAPERLRLPSGRQAKIHYTRGQSPWVASRLQDFFGLRESPRIAQGRVPLLLHLLAPNQRPVQVTGDLAGFWQRLYPQVRRELSRRYPRHAWPEDPMQPEAKSRS